MHYFILKNNRTSALVFYNPVLERIERIEKTPAYRITPRNAEQVFALHAITNPKVKLVTMQGLPVPGKPCLPLQVPWIRKEISSRSILLDRLFR